MGLFGRRETDSKETPAPVPDSGGAEVKTLVEQPPTDAAAVTNESASVTPNPVDEYRTPSYLLPPPEDLTRFGLIAGGGQFPLLLARAARSRNIEVVAFGLRNFADPALEQEANSVDWVELGQVNRLIELFHEKGITHVAMVGRVHHTSIFQYRHFDARALKMLASALNRKADTLLELVCLELAKENIEVIDSTLFMRTFMPKPGPLTTARELTAGEKEDIEFGMPLARSVAGLDIGQSIVVKDKMVLAVEGAEGTDGCIARGAQLGGDGTMLIKVSKPRQNFRFDVPIIGLTTIEEMVKAKASVVAISANESLVFNREEVIAMAEANGIVVVAVENPPPAMPTLPA